MKIRKKPHSNEFKFKVALEAIRGEKTIAALCQEFGVVSSQIAKWKKTLLEEGSGVFKGTGSRTFPIFFIVDSSLPDTYFSFLKS